MLRAFPPPPKKKKKDRRTVGKSIVDRVSSELRKTRAEAPGMLNDCMNLFRELVNDALLLMFTSCVILYCII